MESPVRKLQKRNDYNRHKLLRKIKRRRKAAAEQQAHAAEKALKKKLRVTPPKFEGGKNPKDIDITYVDNPTYNEELGLFKDDNGRVVGDSIVLPELTVRGTGNTQNNAEQTTYDFSSKTRRLPQWMRMFGDEGDWRRMKSDLREFGWLPEEGYSAAIAPGILPMNPISPAKVPPVDHMRIIENIVSDLKSMGSRFNINPNYSKLELIPFGQSKNKPVGATLAKMNPTNFDKLWGNEIVRRIQNNNINTDEQLVEDISKAIDRSSNLVYTPSLTDYGGWFDMIRNKSFINAAVVPPDKINSIYFHEAVMHPTDQIVDKVLTDTGNRLTTRYWSFGDKVRQFFEKKGIDVGESRDWKEVRATSGEFNRHLAQMIVNNNPGKFKADSHGMQKLGASLTETIDNLSLEDTYEILKKIGSEYAQYYWNYLKSNPNSLQEFKNVLKLPMYSGAAYTGYSSIKQPN